MNGAGNGETSSGRSTNGSSASATARFFGKRKASRQFLHVTLQSLTKVIQREAQSKLLASVTLDFTALGASDVQSLARAFKSLTDGGMDVAEAARHRHDS